MMEQTSSILKSMMDSNQKILLKISEENSILVRTQK